MGRNRTISEHLRSLLPLRAIQRAAGHDGGGSETAFADSEVGFG